MGKSKLIDLGIIFLWSSIWAVIFIANSDNLILSSLFTVSVMTTCVPAIYLIIRGKLPLKKLLLATLILGLVYGYLLEVLSMRFAFWTFHHVLFTDKILGTYPDVLLAYIGMALLVFSMYEYFIVPRKDSVVNGMYKHIAVFASSVLVITVALIKINLYPETLPYAYFIVGGVAVLSMVYLLYKMKPDKRAIKGIVILGLIMFVYFFLGELIGVYLNLWAFEGNYLGYILIFGRKLALDDVIYWQIMYGSVIITHYKYFFEIRRKE